MEVMSLGFKYHFRASNLSLDCVRIQQYCNTNVKFNYFIPMIDQTEEPFTYFKIHHDTIYRLWNRFSRKEDGIVRRDPNSGDVHCDGSSEKGDDKNSKYTFMLS